MRTGSLTSCTEVRAGKVDSAAAADSKVEVREAKAAKPADNPVVDRPAAKAARAASIEAAATAAVETPLADNAADLAADKDAVVGLETMLLPESFKMIRRVPSRQN